MSVRPRPVTATINHKPQYESTPLRSDRSFSPYSTGESTHSLISILDHDSLESLLELDHNEPDMNKLETIAPACRDNKDVENDEIASKMKLLNVIETVKEADTGQDIPSEFEKCHVTDKEKSLTAWEQWLIEKAKEEREKLKDEQEKNKVLMEKKREKERQKSAQLKKAAVARKEWTESKSRQQHLAKVSQMRKETLEKEMKEEGKRNTDEKAKQKYEEWTEKKRLEAGEQKAADDEAKKVEDQKRHEKRLSSEKAFLDWKEKAVLRPKSSNSYGYTSGKLTGYYDRGAQPGPAFVNPIPWQPIAAPGPKMKRKPRKSRKTWDPSKYY